MAARTRKLTDADAADWAIFANRLVPLRGRPAAVAPEPPPLPLVEAPRHPARAVEHSPQRTAAPLGVGGQPPGIDTASWQRFRRGQLASARKLDLHGMTAQQAFHALRMFLRNAHADRVRCVEVVTGRGNGEHGGVLRREFAMWLNLPDIRPLILAAVHPHASSAMHAHMANSGSVRLLLRRLRA